MDLSSPHRFQATLQRLGLFIDALTLLFVDLKIFLNNGSYLLHRLESFAQLFPDISNNFHLVMKLFEKDFEVFLFSHRVSMHYL